MGKIVIDPITRIEGHLKIECTVENGVVKEARSLSEGGIILVHF